MVRKLGLAMSGTVGTIKEFLAAKRDWLTVAPDKFDAGRWVVDESNPFTDELIAELRKDAVMKDYGHAGFRIKRMIHYGFLTTRRLDDGRLEVTKARTCPPPPVEQSTNWVAKENAKIQAIVKQEQERRDHAFEALQRAEATLAIPIVAQKRAEFLLQWRDNQDQIRALVRDVVREVVAEVVAEVAAERDQLAGRGALAEREVTAHEAIEPEVTVQDEDQRSRGIWPRLTKRAGTVPAESSKI